MATPSYLSEPQIQSLARLLQEIMEGNLRLPLFQRDFVWNDSQRLELLNSVRDGIPMGSVLIWRTATRRLECFQAIGPYRLPERPPIEGLMHSYLLDGVQRLSTLLGSIHPRVVGSIPEPIERSIGRGSSWDLYYDLEERTFLVHETDEPPPATWQPLWLTLDGIGLLRFQRELAKQPDAERLIQASDELVSAFRDYKIPVLAIVTEDLEHATRIFHRINSRGTPMGEFHMMQALTWNEKFDLRERLTAAKALIKESSWAPEPDEDLFLDVCKVSLDLSLFEENVETLGKQLAANPRLLDDAIDNLHEAVRFLQRKCGVLSAELLPSRYQLILLAEAMRVWRISGKPLSEVTPHIIRWFWLTTYGGVFRAVNRNKLNRLLRNVRSLASGETCFAAAGTSMAVEPLPERFHYRSARSKALAIRLAELRPRDADGRPIDNPLALLARHGADAIVPLVRGRPESANRIIVRPQEAEAIRSLLARRPIVADKDFLASHAITPAALRAIEEHDIEGFLMERQQTLAELDAHFIDPFVEEDARYALAEDALMPF
ncbi:DUF262 domain-containing protein [Archangium primigenium]|uniref:DUF262 domain-containing protein n=1 Tax=[Archangium] primigenium TaxID=2792470 RepID=UPI0019595AD7|nr:DUF262 domain-containing protein [Archangium primigenium]MBM7112524.1 DUF262 domain-containing protein [Archangium primigenium]